MQPFPLHRMAEFAALTPAQRARIERWTQRPRLYPKRSVIRHEGDRADDVFLLHAGWIGASIDLPNAKRQLVKVHLPGDMLGSTSMALALAGDTLEALSDAVVSHVPVAEIGELFVGDPRMAASLFLGAQKERVALMHRLAEVGQTSAFERTGALMLDLLLRGRAAGIVRDRVIDCPMTQEQIGDLLGITPIHINRMIRQLNQAGLIEGTSRRLVVVDEAGLRALAPFQPRFAVEPGWLPPAGG